VAVLALTASVLLAAGLEAGQNRGVPPTTAVAEKALVDKYCVGCHNDRSKARYANLSLEHADFDQLASGGDVWERVIRKVKAGAMPPAGNPRPERGALDALVNSLETRIDAAAAVTPNPGRAIVHRLNRAEYANVVRDLFHLEVDVKPLLPADDSGFGFDNVGDVLGVSPGLLERYLIAGRKIVRQALGDASLRADVATYKVLPLAWQDDRMSDDLPFGSRGGIAVRHTFPVDGEYVIRIEFQKGSQSGNPRGLEVESLVDLRIDGERVKTFRMGGPQNQPAVVGNYQAAASGGVEVRVPVRAGARMIATSLDRTNWAYEGVGPAHVPIGSTTFAQGTTTSQGTGRLQLQVEAVHVAGPYAPKTPTVSPSRDRIMVCRPASAAQEAPCATTILTRIARRAYRRPVTSADVQSLMAYYIEGQRDGGFEAGIQLALEKLMVSPDFLFRVERDPARVAPGAAYRVTDIELASRLSFFLWSSMPDDQLLTLAAQGRLREPAVLERQVRRMLADPKAGALVDNFFGQWLMLRNVPLIARDVVEFPDFDDNLRDAFRRETELFLASQVREDRSVIELLTADYTFVNERLARHYRIAGVSGSRFRRVAYPDAMRAGLFGHGSLLAATAYSNRTSPVLRGKFLLENVLGTPPPAPPANVPPFPENDGTSKPKSVRERMEQHRRNPVCAACHAQIDPLGFALENFDAVGAWRVKDNGSVIDPSGAFPDGVKFDGPATFRTALLSHREQFIVTVTQKLLTYALARGAEYYDMPAVRAIVRDAAAQNYSWSALMLGIVRSAPFQMRRVES
jgi:mono/diheme cytochrome c family protein